MLAYRPELRKARRPTRSDSLTVLPTTTGGQLVAEGKARLSDSVERRLPRLVPDGRPITLRELLDHTSGLFDYSEDMAYFDPGRTHAAPRPARGDEDQGRAFCSA
jgi:CubicO group peptidase (beta-lactamase class C family)